MARKKRIKDTPEAQHARFIETAKAVEADERPEAMDKALRKIAIKRAAPHQRKP